MTVDALDVPAFARLTARLDDPFADRAAVLASTGLDEAGLRTLAAHVTVALREAPESLLRSFGDAYGETCADLARARREPAPLRARDRHEAAEVPDACEHRVPAMVLVPVAPPAPSYGEPGPIAEPVPLPPVVRPKPFLVGTADISAFVPRAATPFVPAALPTAPTAPLPPVVRPPSSISGTTDISTFVPRAATPFAQGAPRRRLVRFDPQTGQPLAEPRWEDLPELPPRQK